RLEVGVGGGHDVDAELAELALGPVDLGGGPVVAAVVHDDGGFGAQPLDLGDLLGGELGLAGRRRVLTVGSLAEDLSLDLGQGGFGRLGNAGRLRAGVG